ncbi:helix-turn-helix domain-containing protein [Cloacibacillus evryensis]|uniref:helix-turn-helix domain-containing protein n=1 Tax=Cloacibacillus evryensis TaxID=508460 RepID=UPI003A8AA827
MRKRKTEERIKAIEMHKQGIPRRRIAEELGVSHDSVKTWISLYKSGQKDLLDDTRKKRTYSKAVKLEAVSAHLEEGRTMVDVTSSFNISSPSLLRRWCKEFIEQGDISSSKQDCTDKKLEVTNSIEKIKELEMQVDVLKKALELQRW